MRIVSFMIDGRESFGVLAVNGLYDLGEDFGGDVRTILTRRGRTDAEAIVAARLPTRALDEVTLLPPVPRPGRIICVGLNYKAHITETGRDTPTYPMFFPRYPDSLVGSGSAMIRPRASAQFDFEGELAVVIGDGGRHIARDRALEHVAGYMAFNDGSIRDFQYKTSQFMAGKCFWRSGASGPWLMTPDEAGSIDAMTLETRLNGFVVQSASLADLLFGVPELIETLSTIFPLDPGDVIATGTPGGVGVARKPPVFMRAGDVVEVTIGPLGTLTNNIEDEE
jgi:2-keto-4-pentenoate hydratase/2-oxohepta-3-ene-1,7-dioic acid hydratase in catechol pathway